MQASVCVHALVADGPSHCRRNSRCIRLASLALVLPYARTAAQGALCARYIALRAVPHTTCSLIQNNKLYLR
eukprot:COSAG01_NODE_5922_length_3950_cov_3.461958_6_plen_72_part_00